MYPELTQVLAQFWIRKIKLIVLTLAMYAALC